MSIIGTRPPLISETSLYELHHRAKEVYGVAEKVVENQDIIEIGNNIQKIRKKNGISQSVLAEKIDVAGNSIYRMEGATTVMGVDKLINIADALNTSPMDILPARFQRERKSLTQEKAEQLQIWNDLNEGNRNIVLTMIGFVIVHTIRMIKDGMSFVRERNVRLLLVVQRGWNIQGEMLMENGQMRNGKNGRLII